MNPEGTVAANTDPASTEVFTAIVSEPASVNADKKAAIRRHREGIRYLPLMSHVAAGNETPAIARVFAVPRGDPAGHRNARLPSRLHDQPTPPPNRQSA